jgi:hypothetical protein
MDQKTMLDIWAEAKENGRRLDNCRRHFFTDELPEPAARFGAKLVCRNCGGKMALLYINFYIRGYVAHGGNGNEIWPGWC